MHSYNFLMGSCCQFGCPGILAGICQDLLGNIFGTTQQENKVEIIKYLLNSVEKPVV